MAVQQLSRPLHAPAHPMAKPGFGKRSVPDEEPRHGRDFAHLPRREAAIATYIDRLPEGADISIKTLARELEDFGQCALGTILNNLSEAGHLRRLRRDVQCAQGARWVQRTFFTRTARPDAWWEDFLADNVPQTGMTDPEPREEPEQRGYNALARLSHQQPQLTLSALECEALADLAAEWFKRGASEPQLLRAVGTNLPTPVHHPFRFVQSRLIDKLPPELPAPVQGRYIMECTNCHAPGTPDSLPGGLCRPCRSEPRPRPADGLPADVVRGKAARLRHTLRTHKLNQDTHAATVPDLPHDGSTRL